MTTIKRILTVLSFGGGQDNTAILLKLVYDRAFRKTYAPQELIMVIADTGNEHDYTYEHVKSCQKLCEDHGIPFFFLTKDQGFHTAAWLDLVSTQLRKAGSKFKETLVMLGVKTCTDKLKLVPIYKFLDKHLNKMMGYGCKIDKGRGCRKEALKRFTQDGGEVRILIGFTKGEERRMEKSKKLEAKQKRNPKDFWRVITCLFPLIDLGMDRATCQDLIEQKLGKKVFPSNCMLCPYMSPEELYWLYLNHREMFGLWCKIEQKKLERNQHLEGTTRVNKKGETVVFKNVGVFGGLQTIPQKLEKVEAKYAHLSDTELRKFLDEHKYSHGCSAGSY